MIGRYVLSCLPCRVAALPTRPLFANTSSLCQRVLFLPFLWGAQPKPKLVANLLYRNVNLIYCVNKMQATEGGCFQATKEYMNKKTRACTRTQHCMITLLTAALLDLFPAPAYPETTATVAATPTPMATVNSSFPGFHCCNFSHC